MHGHPQAHDSVGSHKYDFKAQRSSLLHECGLTVQYAEAIYTEL